MSGFYVDPDMQGVDHQVKSILYQSGLSNWKLIASDIFFQCSLASIFENICMIDPQVFVQFCTVLINHCPDTKEFVEFIHGFLSNNLNGILPGFPYQSDYFNTISNLSLIITGKLGIQRPYDNFIMNHKFFTFFQVNLVVLSYNGMNFNYKSFGSGPLTLYVYSESRYAYCLYSYNPETNPFENFVSVGKPESLFLCWHPLSQPSHSGKFCKCQYQLYNEEIIMVQAQGKSGSSQNFESNYNQANNFFNPQNSQFYAGVQKVSEIPMTPNQPNHIIKSQGYYPGSNNPDPYSNPKSSQAKLGNNVNSTIKPPPQNWNLQPIVAKFYSNPVSAETEKEKTNLSESTSSIIDELKLEKINCKCRRNDLSMLGICSFCKGIFYNKSYSLPHLLVSD